MIFPAFGALLNGFLSARVGHLNKHYQSFGFEGNDTIVLTLYHNDMLVCAANVRAALLEKALDCKFIHLDLLAGDCRRPPVAVHHPNRALVLLAAVSGRLAFRRNRSHSTGCGADVQDRFARSRHSMDANRIGMGL